MEDAMTLWPTLTLGGVGVVQDGGALPNSVPGIGPGPTATGQGVPGGGGVGGAGGAGGGAGNNVPQPGLFNPLFMMLALVMVFMVFTTMMSGRREKKRTAEMLASLKRGDRVLTLGGLIGTVHEVREDSIVLRVDDVSGAKAHFTRGAIQRVLKSAKSSSSDVTDEVVAEAG